MMNDRVLSNTSLGKLFWFNIICFGLTAASFFVAPYFESPHWLTHIQSFLLLTITLPLTGLNLAAIVEKLTHVTLDLFEKLSVAAGLALVAVPFLLSLEYSQFQTLTPTLPLINALAIFLLANWINPLSFEAPLDPSLLPRRFWWSGIGATVFYTALILAIILAYYPLPDLDPYYWFAKYRTDFSQPRLPSLDGYRPLFASLAYIFNQTAGVDLYAFFKYALPTLMLLVLVPATLVARQFPRLTEQLAIFCLPLASASLILYFQIPIPQAILNITLVFFIFFLLYSWITKKDFFYFLAGALAFGAYFYHEVAVFFFLPWVMVTLLHYHRIIWKTITQNRLSALLALLLLLTYATLLINPIYHFVANWMGRGFDLLGSVHLNLAFPATYVNIDGNAVGWDDRIGVMKYYAFYVGPAVLLTLSLFAQWLGRSWQKSSFWHRISEKKEFWILASAMLLFFIVAEVLPRFNIALLPERAWGFAGVLLLACVPIYWLHRPSRTHWFAILFLITILINAGGALYINSLKRYLITPGQMASAEWIKTTLPESRVIFTHGHSSLLKIHSQSTVVHIENPELYSDIRVFNTQQREYQYNAEDAQQRTTETLSNLSSNLEKLSDVNVYTSADHLIQGLTSVSLSVSQLKQYIQSELGKAEASVDHQYYVYYAQTSSRNPYAQRPYMNAQSVRKLGGFDFDQHPERFQRVYALPDDEVVIWKLIQ